MLARLLAAAVVALGVASAHAQYVDPNLQNLLAGLTNGGEVSLVTPLTTGLLQVTSFRTPVRMAAEEIARMLAGGPIEVPAGRFTLPGLLVQSGIPATLVSQIVAPGTPLRRLPDLGIINPSEDQIRTALVGGTLTTLNGVVQLPGLLTR